ncbi:hypothetical protein RUM43_000973 [Polyplax serrata]|uniref:Uncharacterized protein n=1 Tax=Polyplax serrata TaxID=468196 RepID=A0AAN8SI08_POLSC
MSPSSLGRTIVHPVLERSMFVTAAQEVGGVAPWALAHQIYMLPQLAFASFLPEGIGLMTGRRMVIHNRAYEWSS